MTDPLHRGGITGKVQAGPGPGGLADDTGRAQLHRQSQQLQPRADPRAAQQSGGLSAGHFCGGPTAGHGVSTYFVVCVHCFDSLLRIQRSLRWNLHRQLIIFDNRITKRRNHWRFRQSWERFSAKSIMLMQKRSMQSEISFCPV